MKVIWSVPDEGYSEWFTNMGSMVKNMTCHAKTKALVISNNTNIHE
jgi:hypothetical protein